MKIIDLSHKIHIDQTGRFPTTSSKGNKNVMITCDYDSNAVIVRELKTKSARENIENMQHVHQFLISRGINPKMT